MRTISVDDDVFEFLVEKVMHTGESTSSFLRRELELKPSDAPIPAKMAPATGGATHRPSLLADFVLRPEFLVYHDVVSRYLGLLAWLYKQDPDGFKRLVDVGGRKRKYFALSSDELNASGRSVMPKRVPNSPFWAATNNSTALKRRIMVQVMRVLGYSAGDVGIALTVLK